MTFQLPYLHTNKEFTWGPPAEEMTVDDQPFELYFKRDEVVAVDWNEELYTAYRDEQDADSDAPKTKAAANEFSVVGNDARERALKNDRSKRSKPVNRRPHRNNRFRNYEHQRSVKELESTVPITTSTAPLSEFPQNEMASLNLDQMPRFKNLKLAGLPRKYAMEMDKASCSRPILLDESNYDAEKFECPNTFDDGVIRGILPTYKNKKVVVVSDEVLAQIMTSNLTVHPWHVRAKRFNNYLFLDKADGGHVGVQWVGETSTKDIAPSEDSSDVSMRISSLGKESTRVNDCFVRASCQRTRATMKTEKNPYPEREPHLYIYRAYTMHADTPKEYDIVVRCEADAVVGEGGQLTRLFGLLELPKEDGTSEWRKTMATSAAAQLPNAFSMNRGKIGRWIALASLCGASLMKVGFVTRARATASPDQFVHELLSVQSDTPNSLAGQLGVNVRKQWAIADSIIAEIYSKVSNADAFLVKPSGAARLILTNAESDEDESDEEDDDDDDDSENSEDDE